MVIHQNDSSTRGYFTIEDAGVEMGKLHYSWAGVDTLIINHTEVYPEFERNGNGLKLVEAGVEFARKKKVQIIPRCSFAKAMFDLHTDWKDVLFRT